MHVVINRIHFGNFRFIVELEAGREVEQGLLTVWVAEKLAVRNIPLREFSLEQLLYALKNPRRSILLAQLTRERQACQRKFAEQLAALSPAHDRKTDHQAQGIRREQERAMQRLEQSFWLNELLTLDHGAFELETLQAESHLFGEEYFLRHFSYPETDDNEIRQFCYQFAFEPEFRAEVLAKAIRQAQPIRPLFE